MKKSLLWGTVGALVLTGGYYASAASSPLHYTDYGYTPVKVSTTTYAPGTPAQYEYPNSPYQIGGKLGPKAGQTWQQKFDTGTAGRTNTPASPSNQSTVTATPDKAQTPARTTSPVASSNASTSSQGKSEANTTLASGYIAPNVTLSSLGASVQPQQILATGWQNEYFDDVYFTINPSWRLVQDSPGNAMWVGKNGGVNVTVTPGGVYGSQWDWDQTHLVQFVDNTYGVPSKGWIPQIVPNSYDGPPNETWDFTATANSMPFEQLRFTLPQTNQSGYVAATPYGVFTVVYTGHIPGYVLSQDNPSVNL